MSTIDNKISEVTLDTQVESSINTYGFMPNTNSLINKSNLMNSIIATESSIHQTNNGDEIRMTEAEILDNRMSKSPITMPDETKSMVYSSYGTIKAAIYNNGRRVEDRYIMPDIIDVTVTNNMVVFVTFADKTKEKAVLASSDYFSLEQGISICITKKLLSMKTKNNGSSVYNKIIKRGLKVIEDKEKQEEAAKQEEQNKRNRINKLKAKKVRKANAAREAQIEMQKEAYLRAMREFNGTSTNAPCFDVVEQ